MILTGLSDFRQPLFFLIMDKKSYALGMSIANSLIQSKVKNIDFESFKSGVQDIMSGKEPSVPYKEAEKILDEYFAALEAEQAAAMAEIGESMKEEGSEFLKKNKNNSGVIELPSGLQYKILKESDGDLPTLKSKVKCHYEGRFINGQIFDSSYKRGEPAVFGVTQVIKGWTEALQLMSKGSKWELYIPYNLAYGETGSHGSIPPYCTLIFTVELIDIL